VSSFFKELLDQAFDFDLFASHWVGEDVIRKIYKVDKEYFRAMLNTRDCVLSTGDGLIRHQSIAPLLAFFQAHYFTLANDSYLHLIEALIVLHSRLLLQLKASNWVYPQALCFLFDWLNKVLFGGYFEGAVDDEVDSIRSISFLKHDFASVDGLLDDLRDDSLNLFISHVFENPELSQKFCASFPISLKRSVKGAFIYISVDS
jgi:hypothetical protein